MKKITRKFSITWSENLGPMWMNVDNLKSCLFSETHISNVKVEVKDETDRIRKIPNDWGETSFNERPAPDPSLIS